MINVNNKTTISNPNQVAIIPNHNTPDALLEFLNNTFEEMNKSKVL